MRNEKSVVVSTDSCSLIFVSSRWDYAKSIPKSKLLVELEMQISSCHPGTTDIRIVDEMFFLYFFADLALTFGPLEKLISQVRKKWGTQIHLAFDRTIISSIKDFDRNYQATRTEQKQLSNWLQSLRVNQLKKDWLNFL